MVTQATETRARTRLRAAVAPLPLPVRTERELPATVTRASRDDIRGQRSRRGPTVLRVVDALALLATAATCALVLPTPEGLPLGWMATALFVTWYIILGMCGTRSSSLAGSAHAECKGILRATFTVAGALAIAALVTADSAHRDLLFVALPVGALLVLTLRWLLRLCVSVRAPAGLRPLRTVVVGASSDLGTESALQRGSFGHLYEVVDSVSAATSSRSIEDGGAVTATVPGLDQVLAACEHARADVVIVAGALAADRDLVRALGWSLEGTGRDLVLAPLPANISQRRLKMLPVEGLPLIQVHLPTFRGGKYHVKRIFDVVAAATALVFLSPLILLVGAVIRAEDGQPALFKQRRVGIDGRHFTMFKFRTMCVDAEARLEGLRSLDEGNGVLFKVRNDPRVTRVGRWLRKFSIDEVPQLLNVLGGSMSLVGPRPPLPSEVAVYAGRTSRRLLVKPGLTGLWQVNGRSDLGWDESVDLDLYYVENWSVGLDLAIIQRTIRVVLRPVGAY